MYPLELKHSLPLGHGEQRLLDHDRLSGQEPGITQHQADQEEGNPNHRDNHPYPLEDVAKTVPPSVVYVIVLTEGRLDRLDRRIMEIGPISEDDYADHEQDDAHSGSKRPHLLGHQSVAAITNSAYAI